ARGGPYLTGPNSATGYDIPIYDPAVANKLADLGVLGIAMVAPSGGGYVTGYYLHLPTIQTSGGGDMIVGDPGSYAGWAHALIMCHLCSISEAAAGTTAFVGTDGSNTPILGKPSGAPGAGGFHMAAFGPSVDCEADESVCVGHGATVYGPNSVVVGSGASNT